MPGPDPPFNPDRTVDLIRTDSGARKFIDRIDDMRDEVAGLKASTVKYDRLIAILGAAATVIVSAAWKVQVDSLNRLEANHIENMRAFRSDVQEDLRRAAIYSRASYDVTVEKKSPAAVAQEVRAATDAGVR